MLVLCLVEFTAIRPLTYLSTLYTGRFKYALKLYVFNSYDTVYASEQVFKFVFRKRM